MTPERATQPDDALARMRAAFADVPEEQILEDVAQIIEQDRERRRTVSFSTSE